MYQVLLLCSDNSVLSPMAEGYFRQLMPEDAEVFSAGIARGKINSMAIKVMQEDKIDISGLHQNILLDLRHIDFDYVLTFDQESEAESHHLPSKPVKYHYDFDKILSPENGKNTEEKYRNVRDQLKKIIRSFIKEHFNQVASSK